jgi:membrane-associated protease RseP (regulator of RpoE activity)
MDFYLISIIVFIIALAAFVYRDRKKFTREFILLTRRTNFGKGFITWLGTRFPRWWKAVGFVSVLVCFFVSAWFFWQILLLTVNNLTTEAAPGVGVILPSLSPSASAGPGYFAIPFWYWVIIIGLLALVHEGFHGIMSAREKIRIKSLGAGLLAVLPFAFVEPDEKQLARSGAWPQLRVFSAGSFANFLLAGLSAFLLITFMSSMFMNAGVAFQTYPATQISAGSITAIGGIPIASLSQMGTVLGGMGNGTVEISADGKVFYSTPPAMLEQLNSSGELIVFEGYGAVKANLTGTIVMIEGREVRTLEDLELVLEDIGPGRNITVTTSMDGETSDFVVGTSPEPEPGFAPDVNTAIVAGLEHVIPGTVEFTQAASNSISEFFGSPERADWKTIQQKKGFWEWAGENYPALSQRAGERIAALEAELGKHPRAGFIGVAAVMQQTELRAGLEPYEGPIGFVEGLLFWMFLINFGVGAFNLLPIGPLDGGKMWAILARKVAKKRHKTIMSFLSSLTVLLVLVNLMIPFAAFF